MWQKYVTVESICVKMQLQRKNFLEGGWKFCFVGEQTQYEDLPLIFCEYKVLYWTEFDQKPKITAIFALCETDSENLTKQASMVKNGQKLECNV